MTVWVDSIFRSPSPKALFAALDFDLFTDMDHCLTGAKPNLWYPTERRECANSGRRAWQPGLLDSKWTFSLPLAIRSSIVNIRSRVSIRWDGPRPIANSASGVTKPGGDRKD